MYPEDFLKEITKKIRYEWRFSFLTAFTAGLLIHLYRLTNHLLTWDSVYNFHSSQNTIHLGRCFLSLACGIGSYYDLQWVNGLLSLLYLSLCCVCLTELFSLKKRTSIFLLCALTVAFPSVASTFAYMYTADGYFFAMLTAAFAVLLTLKYKRGFLPGILLLAISYGAYQAYVSYAVMLILSWCILQLLFEKLSLRDLFIKLLHFFLMGAGGTLLYLICSKVLSLLENVSSSDYNGIASMSLPDAAGFVYAVKNCIVDFAYFFFGPLGRVNLFQLLNAALFLLLSLLFLWMLYRQGLYQRAGRFCLLLICLFSMPFVCSMIYFLSPQVRYYMLMYAGFSLIYLLPVLLYENMTGASYKKAFPICLSWACVLITALHIFNFALIDNISYLYMTKNNEMTLDLVSRMTDRIEQLEDYPSLKKLCVIGHFKDYDTIALNLPPAMAGVRDSYILSEQAHFAAAMDTYYGLSLENCSETERQEIQDSALFAEMGCWPDTASVRRINDTVVIKISDQKGDFQ